MNRWRKYRNYLCGRPITHGDYDQVRMMELLQFPESACDGYYENPEIYCPRCSHKFYARVVCLTDERGRQITKIMTPRVYTCQKCGGRVLYWRAGIDDMEESDWQFYEGELIRRFLRPDARPDELEFLNRGYDPLPYYDQIKKHGRRKHSR